MSSSFQDERQPFLADLERERVTQLTSRVIRDRIKKLKDEQRSVMTRQTIENGRQRVIEYERKRRLAKS